MKPLLFYIILLLIFDLIGFFILELLKKCLKDNIEKKYLLNVVIGSGVMVCISQCLSIAFNASIIALIWWAILIFICLFYNKKYFMNLIQRIRKNYILIIGALGSFCLFTYPMIKSNELLSYQYQNNDIIYYLATIDWLHEHSLLQKVIYTTTRPLYLCAEYIFSTTRFGTDTFASTLSQMLHLEAHEIFSFLGIAFITITGIVVYYLARYIFKMSKSSSLIIYFLAVLFFNWKELLILQYVPQMLGICFFMAFIIFLIEYYNTSDRYAMAFSSLFLAATACTYAEYSSYMFIIYLGFIVIQCAYTRNIWGNIKAASLIGILGVLCNPLGFLIAVKFNLNIFNTVKASASNIDAYGGNMKSIPNILAQLLGFPNDYRISNMYLQKFYCFILMAGMLFLVTSFLFMVFKTRTKTLFFCTWVLVFFAGYEFYFRIVNLAYGEFKHLIGIGIMAGIILLYATYTLEKSNRKILFTVIAFFTISLNLINFIKTYPYNETVFYDTKLVAARNALDLIPKGKTIGILGNAHYIQHELVYTAKDYDVNLMGSGINSYFTMLGIPLNNEKPDYILCKKDTPELNSDITDLYSVIWNNSQFMIVKLGEE